MVTTKSSVIWTMAELVKVLKQRQDNEYDVNIAVSGKRGDGKSTLILKLFKRFKGFKQKKHQVYSREDIINLLKKQQFSFCWDDEAINSGYKREFQTKGQHELIKIITTYRDNFNIFASAIPFFYSLDKDLRELVFLHIHIIKRGLAIISMPLQDNIHQTDPWDTKNNSKKEEGWQLKKIKDPEFRFPYHRLSTFIGYLKFSDATEKQKALYKQIKIEKRGFAFDNNEATKEHYELDLVEKLYKKIMDGKIGLEGLKQTCILENQKYTNVSHRLNKMLQNNNMSNSLRFYLKDYAEKQRKDKRTWKDKKDYDKQFYEKNRVELLRKQKKKYKEQMKDEKINKRLEKEIKEELKEELKTNITKD